jgi:hypothetical protein
MFHFCEGMMTVPPIWPTQTLAALVLPHGRASAETKLACMVNGPARQQNWYGVDTKF